MAEVSNTGSPSESTALASRLPEWLDPRRWRYAVPGSRDLRLDFLRGYLVIAMVVDHVGGESVFTKFTGHNAFLVSAAEGFVFISGLLMGIVYGGRMTRLSLHEGMEGVLRRVGRLHVTVAALTLAFVGMYLFTDWPLWYDRRGGLGVVNPLEAVAGALTLHYSFNGTDVLVIYVQMIIASPLILYMLYSGRTAIVLVGSWLVWLVFQVFPTESEFLWTVHNSIFPFSTWQALFNTGIVLGYHRQHWPRLAAALGWPPLVAALALAMPVLWRISDLYNAGQINSLGLPWLTQEGFLPIFGKSNLGPGRLLAFFVVGVLAQQLVTRAWLPLSRAFGWLLVPLGRGALVAYGAHLFLLGPYQGLFSTYLYGDQHSLAAATIIHLLLLAPVFVLITCWRRVSGFGEWVVGRVQRALPLGHWQSG